MSYFVIKLQQHIIVRKNSVKMKGLIIATVHGDSLINQVFNASSLLSPGRFLKATTVCLGTFILSDSDEYNHKEARVGP